MLNLHWTMKPPISFTLSSRNSKTLFYALISTGITLSTWLIGFSANPSGQGLTATWGEIAQAQDSQTFSDQDIKNYARAVLALESRRYEVINEIKKIVGEVPRIVCDEPSSINALPGNAPRLAVSYCEQAKRVIETKGLTVTRFNDMTRRQQTDPKFRQRIQSEILRLLENPSN